MLLPGRRPSEGEAAGPGVAEVRALHGQGHEAGGHRIPGQAGKPGLKVFMDTAAWIDTGTGPHCTREEHLDGPILRQIALIKRK